MTRFHSLDRTNQERESAVAHMGHAAILLAALAFGGLASSSIAGGGPENLLMIIDPQNAESMYVGNYYKDARGIPDRNVIYTNPGATNYATFAVSNLDALFGSLGNLGIEDHIDYILVLPGASFYVSASGYISDDCYPVSRFSASSAYTMAFIKDEIIGGLPSTTGNRYYANSDAARAFDSSVSWLSGDPSSNALARRYFIGAMLGYSGPRGNTLAETIAMIDRSVAVDGTRPTGTFYFMNNPGDPDRNVRAGQYDAAVASIIGLGGSAMKVSGVLPIGHYDCLGIMTGAASPDIDGGAFGILSGAFCDHLTSWAGMFDNSSQTKLSRWIVKGASGSHGATEEPCNYTGKFPHARMHVFYYQGLSLGEAVLRSLEYVPFQTLLYGDPLTRPFAYLPQVSVPDAPSGPVSGTITLTPVASTSKPGAQIDRHDLYVDGSLVATVDNGGAFNLNTTTLADGSHDVRVVSYDDTLVASQGRWLGRITVNNLGRSAALGVSPPTGDRSTLFSVTASASGGTVSELRLLQNNRVLAAAAGSPASFNLLGDVFGAGPVTLVTEAQFAGGGRALSQPAIVNVTYANPPAAGGPIAPVAYSYAKDVPLNEPILLELPASDQDGGGLTYTVHTLPTQATVEGGGPVRLLRPNANAAGSDSLTFSVNDSLQNSNVATVTIRYLYVPPDTTPPQPSPMTWAAEPAPVSTTAVTMTATEATDATPPVQYYFYTSPTGGGHSSGWINERAYSDSGLTPNTVYSYLARARDGAVPPNAGFWSVTRSTATRIQTPTGLTSGATTETSIEVSATGTFTNLTVGGSGLYFECLEAGTSSGWIQGTGWTAAGLTPGTAYTFRVKARNQNSVETASVQAVFSTQGAVCATQMGDVNGDGVVDGLDIAAFVRVVLTPPGGPGDHPACADYGPTLEDDLAGFVADLLGV